MSYIGRLPIKIPEEVNVVISADSKNVTVSGPYGELSASDISGVNYSLNSDGSALHVSIENKKYRRFWGLARTLASNNIVGVSRQFTLKLDLVGVGYRAEIFKEDENVLELQLGFSHNILLDIPKGIKVECDLKKKTNILLSGNNKDLLAQFASKIRSFRLPEPYKGKGIRFTNESIRRKEGKKK